MANLKFEDLQKKVEILKEHEIDILGVNLKQKDLDVLVSEEQLSWLKKRHRVVVKHEKSLLTRPDQEYKNSEEIAAFLKSMSEQYPNISKLIKIGSSVEGRDIWAIKDF